MLDQPPRERQKPGLTDAAQAEHEARRARSAAALRQNLRRRKEQARMREDAAPSQPPHGSDER